MKSISRAIGLFSARASTRTASYQRMSFLNNRPMWALSYLNGRVRAFRRVRLTLNHVAGAVRMAARYGARKPDIAALLQEYSLIWDDRSVLDRLRT